VTVKVIVWGILLLPSSGYTLNLECLCAKVHGVASSLTVLFLFTAMKKTDFKYGRCSGKNDK